MKISPATRPWIYPILCLLALVPFSLLGRGVPLAHDLPDHLAMAAQVREGFTHGEIYPRWFADLNHGWGEPTGTFYPPLLHWLTAGLSGLLGGSLIKGLFAALGIFSLVGALGTFRLARREFGDLLALGAAAFCLLAPYRFFEFYGAGLYSAHAAVAFLPWIWSSWLDLAEAEDGRRACRAIVGFAAFYALLALTNLPLLILTTYLVAFVSLLECLRLRRPAILGRGLLAGCLGAALAGIYLVPALGELPSLRVPHSGAEPLFRENFVFQVEGSWMPEGLRELFSRMALFLVAPAVLSTILLLPGSRDRSTGERPAGSSFRSSLIALALGGFFLLTPPSAFLWERLPVLHQVNMPWRLLGVLAVPAGVLLAGCLATGLSVARREGTPVLLRTLGAAAIAAAIAWGGLVAALDLSISEMNGVAPPDSEAGLVGSFYRREAYFLPRGAGDPVALRALPRISVETPGTWVDVEKWEPRTRMLSVRAESPAKIGLKTFFFPGWRAEILGANGAREVPLTRDEATGGIEIVVPPGEHAVRVAFVPTLWSWLGVGTSLGAACLAGVCWWLSRREKQANEELAGAEDVPEERPAAVSA